MTIAAFLALAGVLAQDDPSEARKAVERSLPFIRKEGVSWIENKKCASCHHVTFMVWSLNLALEKGLPVEKGKVEGWNEWLLSFSLGPADKGEDGNGGGLETMGQIIMGRPSYGDGPAPEPYRKLAGMIHKAQTKAGNWKAGGQLPFQRRPKQETTQVSTMWTLLSLRSLGADDEKGRAVREKALAWLKDAKPGKSSESLFLHLLMDREFGGGKRVDALRKEILELQNEDGGWSWLKGEPSDPFATGQALYTMAEIGMKPDAAPVRRAQAWLVNNQREDGAWYFRSTKKKPKAHKMATYWGTTWAAIGLLRTLPD